LTLSSLVDSFALEVATMRTVSIAARISEQLNRDLGKLSAATGRSKSWLVADALESYVQSEKPFIEAVEEGIKAYEEGRVVEHDTVVAELERRYRSG
jgi:predicted transcriptional regulator